MFCKGAGTVENFAGASLHKLYRLLSLRPICERFIYFQDRSAYSAAGKYVDRSWDFINGSYRHMNVEIGTEAGQFPEKEYISRIFLAVDMLNRARTGSCTQSLSAADLGYGHCLHLSLAEKSSVDHPAFEISCSWLSPL
jgi:hypothetical protein